MMAQDQSIAQRTIRTVIETGETCEQLTRDMDPAQAHHWSHLLIDCGFVIEQSNAIRTVFVNQTTRRRAWSINCALYRPDMPIVV
jgi:hypothetical protein